MSISLQESSSIAIELDEAEVSSLLATKNNYGMGQTCRNPGTLMFTPKYLINGFSSPQVLGPIGLSHTIISLMKGSFVRKLPSYRRMSMVSLHIIMSTT